MISRRIGLAHGSGLSPRLHTLLTQRRGTIRPTFAARYPATWTSRAWESTTTGDEQSGHIATGYNESILWFDNLFPLKLAGFLRVLWRSSDRDLSDLLNRFENSTLGSMDPIKLVKRALPDSLPIKVTEILPRLKDGGVFVKFSHPAALRPKEVEGTVSQLLRESPVRPLFNPFRSVKAGLVKGVPWLEDLYRFPFRRLRVEFVPKNPGEEVAELSHEDLYSLFRRYGKIAEIVSQPFDSKAVPRYAYVDFALIRDSIMARNCLHGFVVEPASGGGKDGTKLRMSYEKPEHRYQAWNWITSHPRIVIPILLALLTGITVVVFDPIRSFFVKAHVSHQFDLSHSRLFKWLRRQTSDIFTFRRRKSDQAGLNAVWSHRKDLIDQIRKWLEETAETFIVVQGPRGSGKKELVLEQALKGRGNILVLDCRPIVEARGESGTIKNLAAEVGYRPTFSWANNISSLLDLAIQGTTGVKAGFSETLDSQLQKILQTTAGALSELAVSGRKKDDADASLAPDAYLEAHPERRPVVVIENFLHKGEGNGIVYDKITDWAAALVQSNVAHVIFLTNDTSYSKSLAKALPDRVFRAVALGDLSPDVAKRFVLSHLEGDDEPEVPSEDDSSDDKKQSPQKKRPVNMSELDDCIGTLGGRLTDLEFLARRLRAGQTPQQAVSEITEQSASEVLKMFLQSPGKSGDDKIWSVEQAWSLIKALASSDSLRYNEILLANTFSASTTVTSGSGESALDALAGADLISIRTHNGRAQRIAPGKPVYRAAFARLTRDPVLAAKMDLAVLMELSKIEARGIEKVEGELALLGGLPRQPAQTAGRVSYLLAKLEGSQKKIEGYEREMAELKKVLNTEY